MGEVIYATFGQRATEQTFDALRDYLASLEDQGLDADDVLDVEEAIRCLDCYENSDEVVRDLADAFNADYL